jgi:hypothetical protein
MANNKELLEQIYQEMAQTQSMQKAISVIKRVRFNPEKAKNVALLDQLGREVTGGEPPPLVARRLGPIVLDTGNLALDDAPVVMQGNLTAVSGRDLEFQRPHAQFWRHFDRRRPHNRDRVSWHHVA